MKKMNLSKVDRIEKNRLVPPGTYDCKVGPVEVACTQSNCEMWKIPFRITDGPYQGYVIPENLVFSDRAMPRARLLFESLGVDVSKEIDMDPGLIEGRSCSVTTDIGEFNSRPCITVPFDGFGPPMGTAVDSDTVSGRTDSVVKYEIPF